MRGDQPRVQVQWLYDDAFTPHARGSTRRSVPRMAQKKDSPCMRGGQPRTPSPFEGDIGFSPHARGSTRSNRVDDTGGTILPACAGVNLSREWLYEPVYSPRMRGDQPASKKTRSTLSGFSPHARGSTLPQIAYYVATRIHPACAGINLVLVDFDDLDIYLPRMRGGQPDFVVDAYTTLFFPLHMQGCSFFTTQKCLEEIT